MDVVAVVPVVWIPFLIVLWFNNPIIMLVLVKVLLKLSTFHSILNVVLPMLTFFSCELSEHHDGLHSLILFLVNGFLRSLVLRDQVDVILVFLDCCGIRSSVGINCA